MPDHPWEQSVEVARERLRERGAIGSPLTTVRSALAAVLGKLARAYYEDPAELEAFRRELLPPPSVPVHDLDAGTTRLVAVGPPTARSMALATVFYHSERVALRALPQELRPGPMQKLAADVERLAHALDTWSRSE